jgi:hypothetical protein
VVNRSSTMGIGRSVIWTEKSEPLRHSRYMGISVAYAARVA